MGLLHVYYTECYPSIKLSYSSLRSIYPQILTRTVLFPLCFNSLLCNNILFVYEVRHSPAVGCQGDAKVTSMLVAREVHGWRMSADCRCGAVGQWQSRLWPTSDCQSCISKLAAFGPQTATRRGHRVGSSDLGSMRGHGADRSAIKAVQLRYRFYLVHRTARREWPHSLTRVQLQVETGRLRDKQFGWHSGHSSCSSKLRRGWHRRHTSSYTGYPRRGSVLFSMLCRNGACNHAGTYNVPLSGITTVVRTQRTAYGRSLLNHLTKKDKFICRL